MDFLIAAGAWKKKGFEAFKSAEDTVVREMKAEGVLSAPYRKADGSGVFGIIHAKDLAEAKAQVARVPLIPHWRGWFSESCRRSGAWRVPTGGSRAAAGAQGRKDHRAGARRSRNLSG